MKLALILSGVSQKSPLVYNLLCFHEIHTDTFFLCAVWDLKILKSMIELHY